jgi:predicted RNA-binding protein YlxR (DUF448 family)
LGCGASDDRDRLLRLSVDSRAELKVDPCGEGRGGYLHRNPECWQAFLRRKSLQRAFRAEIDRAAKEKLIQELRKRVWE